MFQRLLCRTYVFPKENKGSGEEDLLGLSDVSLNHGHVAAKHNGHSTQVPSDVEFTEALNKKLQDAEAAKVGFDVR